jgi:DNA-directed RNA polymerase II subunit RPB1
MNLHLPQSVTTATELQELAGVSSQIISPRECKPIISVVQDIALGIFRLTKNNVYLTDKQMMNLMSTNLKFDGTMPRPDYNKDGVKKWTGRQALSTIIPKNITVKPPKVDVNNKNVLIIENGEIIQGTVDKGMYQSRTKGLVHSIVNECGAEEARLFFDNTQKLICNWLVNAGFSVGISDLIVDEETKTDLAATIHDMKVKVYDMIKNIHLGKFDNRSINTNSEYFEDEVNNILNQAREAVGKKALAKIDDNVNRMINMVKSGSKGSILNVSQMVACLGQQNVEGKRIAYGFDDRTLPHYVRYDDGPDSRGFVENSFIKGLSPQEFFFHAMGGREGLIDKPLVDNREREKRVSP